MNYITRKQQKDQRRGKEVEMPPIDICENAYWNGPTTKCTCKKFHDLDFDKLRRGTCQLQLIGQCRCRDNCWFSHEIPQCVKENRSTIEKARQFVEERKKRYRNGETTNNGNAQRISGGNRGQTTNPEASQQRSTPNLRSPAPKNNVDEQRSPYSSNGQTTRTPNPQSSPVNPQVLNQGLKPHNMSEPNDSGYTQRTSDNNGGQKTNTEANQQSRSPNLQYPAPENNEEQSFPKRSIRQTPIMSTPFDSPTDLQFLDQVGPPQCISEHGYNGWAPQHVYVPNPMLQTPLQIEQPTNTTTSAHDPFLLLVRNMIQDQIRQAMMAPPPTAMPPPTVQQYPQNQIFSA